MQANFCIKKKSFIVHKFWHTLVIFKVFCVKRYIKHSKFLVKVSGARKNLLVTESHTLLGYLSTSCQGLNKLWYKNKNEHHTTLIKYNF